MAETETPPTLIPDPETEKVIAALHQDFQKRGPLFWAMVEALVREIMRGGQLARTIRQLFQRELRQLGAKGSQD